MRWFRFYAEFSSDPKVQSLSETLQRRLVMLFCLRCNGDLPGLGDDEIAFALRITRRELDSTKTRFISKGFIDGFWNILNWDKRQFSSDNVSERVQRFREKKRGNETLLQRCKTVTVTAPEQIQNRTDTEQKKERDLCSEPQKNNGSKPSAPSIISIPLLGKIEYPITQKDVDQWQEVFPAVEVLACLRHIRQWNMDNPTRRKTGKGITKHITSWLASEQDKGGGKFKRNEMSSEERLRAQGGWEE